MQNRDFKGIWIPANVWLDERLNALEKVILAEIDSLDGEKGCWAGNDYISEFCQCSASKVSKAVSKLIDLGYVRVESFNGRTRVLRSCLSKNDRQSSIIYEADEQNLLQSNIKNKQKNNNIRSASAPLDFDRFWKAYPLKKAKQAALKAWKKINPDKQLVETIIAAVEKQKRWEDWNRDNGKYIPHPATWLNQGRWEDEERSYGEQKQKEKCIDTKYVYEQLEAAQKYWAEREGQGLNEQ